MPRADVGSGRMSNWLGGRLPAAGTRNPPRLDAGLIGDISRGAYRGVFQDVGKLRLVWRNRHAFPTTGTVFPSQAFAQFTGRFVSEMRHARNVGGFRGVTHTLSGNADLAADLTKIGNLAPTSGSPLSFANAAFRQSVIGGGAWMTGAGVTLSNTTQIPN